MTGGDLFREALNVRRRMLLPSHRERDPGLPMRRGKPGGVILPGGKVLKVDAIPPPVEGGLGNTGHSVQVGHKLPERGAVLVVNVDLASLAGLNPETCRMFWWDERRDCLRLVPRSGLGADGSYVYAEINRPGRYAVFGLPADRARLDTLMAWQHLRGWAGYEKATRGGADPLRRRLCNLILCAGLASAAPDLLDDFGLGDRIKGRFGRPEFVKGAKTGRGGRVTDRPEDEIGPLSPPLRPPAPQPPARPPGNICDECFGLGSPLPGDFADLPRPTPADQLARDYAERCAAWVFEGPTNRAGRVRGLAWNPRDTSIVYMGNSQGGVFKSANSGKSWVPVFGTAQVVYSIGAITLDPRDPDTVYAATGEYRNASRSQAGLGVYRSTDGGRSWELFQTTANTRHAKIEVDPSDSDVLYACGDAGLERSADRGETWSSIFGTRCSAFVFDPTNTKRMIITAEDSTVVYVTADVTANRPVWTAMATGLPSVSPALDFGRLAAGADSDGKLVLWCKLRRNDDPMDPRLLLFQWDGTQWNQVADIGADNTQGDYNNILFLDPESPQIVYHGERGLYWSSDGGATFVEVETGHADQHAIAFEPGNPKRMLVGNDGGVYEVTRPDVPAAGVPTTDDLTLADMNAGNDTLQLRNCSAAKRGALTVIGSSQDQGIARYTGQSAFKFIRGTENGPVHAFAADGKTIWWDPGGGPAYTMLSTRDGGETVRNAGSGLPSPMTNNLGLIAIHPTDRKVGLVAGGGVVYRTTNGAGEPAENVISLPNTVLNGATDFTISIWIRTINQPSTSAGGARGNKNSGNYALISGASAATGANSMLLYRYASDTSKDQDDSGAEIDELIMRTTLRGLTIDYTMPAAIEDDAWHHVCWVRSARVESVFIDGVALSNADTGNRQSRVNNRALVIDPGGLVLGQEQTVVGGGFAYDQAFQDRMRDVACFRAAMSAAQVRELFGGTVPAGFAPVARYPFHFNGSDATGNGNDAEIDGPRPVSATSLRSNEGVDFKAFFPVLTLGSGISVTALAFAPGRPERAYAAASDGSLYTSANTGATWTKVGRGALSGVGIAHLAVDWIDPLRIFAGYSDAGARRSRVHRSDDGGDTWHDVSGAIPAVQLPDLEVTGIVIDPHSSETLYVATLIGPFATHDGGATWQPFDNGMPNALMTGLDIRIADNTLYASTYGRGLWSRRL